MVGTKNHNQLSSLLPPPIEAIKTITTTYPSKKNQKNYNPTKYIRKLIRMRTKTW
jgi:hypothetical protein